MSTGSIPIRAITFAEHLLPRKAKPSVAKLVEVDAAEQEVERKTKRSKIPGYYSPEWWESHHYERR
jgi:hypothetical protein